MAESFVAGGRGHTQGWHVAVILLASAFTVLNLYTKYTAFFLVLAQDLWLLATHRWQPRQILRLAASHIVAGSLFALYLPSALAGAALAGPHADPDAGRPDYRRAALLIAQSSEPGDRVVGVRCVDSLPLGYYLATDSVICLSANFPTEEIQPGVDLSPLSGARRLWFVMSSIDQDLFEATAAQQLSAGRHLALAHSAGRLSVLRYDLTESPVREGQQ